MKPYCRDSILYCGLYTHLYIRYIATEVAFTRYASVPYSRPLLPPLPPSLPPLPPSSLPPSLPFFPQSKLVVFCHYPFVLNAEAKARLMYVESQYQQQVGGAHRWAWLVGGYG